MNFYILFCDRVHLLPISQPNMFIIFDLNNMI